MKKKSTLLTILAATLLYSHSSQAQLINTFAGNGFGAHTGTGGYTGDGGLANQAELNSMTGVAFDGAGNVYIADQGNNVIRKVNVAGVISTFAGTGTAGYSGDGGQATLAKLNHPYSVAADIAGNVYISDEGNNVIRIVTTSGVIGTYAGSGTVGSSGDGGHARTATLYAPQGIAVDTLGNLYIADAGNNKVREVMGADTSIVTFAGNGFPGYSGDGGLATDAQLQGPTAVATDIFGNVYIADYYNNAVRKVDAAGGIITFAGTGIGGYSGNGGPAAAASLRNPSGVATYGYGDVYIADQANNTIRKVNATGTISTFAGTVTNGYTGDGGYANAAQISSPKGLAMDALQRLFIADYDNNVIRVVYTTTKPSAVSPVTNEGTIKVYPDPSTGSFTIDAPQLAANSAISVVDMLGRSVYSGTVAAGANVIDIAVPAGSYILTVSSATATYRQQISVIK